MTLSLIYAEFKSLNTSAERVKYLTILRDYNLTYEINYENLIKYWSEN